MNTICVSTAQGKAGLVFTFHVNNLKRVNCCLYKSNTD